MLKNYEEVMADLGGYLSPKSKLSRMIAKGEIFPIVRGIYGTEAKGNPRYPVAMMMDARSYISFETALAYHRLMPVNQDVVSSASLRRRKKEFTMGMGRYVFRPIPNAVFAEGQLNAWEQERPFRMATAEKALCDLLYLNHRVTSLGDLEHLMFRELGIDGSRLERLEWETIKHLAKRYSSTTLNTLIRWRNKEEKKL